MKFKKLVFDNEALYIDLAEYNRVMFFYPTIYTNNYIAFCEMASLIIDLDTNAVIKASVPLSAILEPLTSDDLMPRNYCVKDTV